jgi:hypothetical protein
MEDKMYHLDGGEGGAPVWRRGWKYCVCAQERVEYSVSGREGGLYMYVLWMEERTEYRV